MAEAPTVSVNLFLWMHLFYSEVLTVEVFLLAVRVFFSCGRGTISREDQTQFPDGRGTASEKDQTEFPLKAEKDQTEFQP